MPSKSAEETKLRELFSRFGVPEVLVSNNGPQFVTKQFEEFVKLNRMKHVRSAAYHLSMNGLAERFVRTMKEAVRKDCQGRPLELRLVSFLLTCKNTPHARTQQSPASLLFGRSLRTRLDLLRPDPGVTVRYKQFQGRQ